MSDLRSVLQKYGFQFKKQFGQNFISDTNLLSSIVTASGIDENTTVVEIGCGAGTLTRAIAKKAKKVYAFDVDVKLQPVLAETLAGQGHVKIVQGDCMKLDLHRLLREEFGDRPVSVCANLPYYITSPILMKLLEERLPVESITVMVQKEAAERICAAPGTREAGAISLAVRYYATPQVLFSVSPGSFTPPPKVTSAVIKLTLHSTPPVQPRDEKRMFRIIRAAFSQRRKTAVNGICSGMSLSKEAVAAAFAAAGIAPMARPEQMTLEDFCALEHAFAEAGLC